MLDGDGNLLFNLASLADVAVHNPGNLIDLVFVNECYQSCDNFPSVTSKGVNLEAIANGCGIKNAATVRELKDFERAVDAALAGSEFHLFSQKLLNGGQVAW